MRAHLTACLLLGCAALAAAAPAARGATGCSLNDPDRDIRRLFPTSTGYRTDFLSIEDRGGAAAAAQLEAALGDKLDPLYEALDVPYSYYTVLSGTQAIGYVHGVNQKGKYGGMQLILATDTNRVIQAFYYQKISSPEAKRFREPAFTDQFKGLSLADFRAFRQAAAADRAQTRVGGIKDPTEKSGQDFAATLRGLLKNLLLLDLFKPKA